MQSESTFVPSALNTALANQSSKPERIEVKNAEDMSQYVEDNYRSSEWRIPGGSGAPFQSIIGQDTFDSDLVPLVFVIAEGEPQFDVRLLLTLSIK